MRLAMQLHVVLENPLKFDVWVAFRSKDRVKKDQWLQFWDYS